MRLDWNDLRFFDAVLEYGSTARAAKALGVDQTTCARRITALEQALGLQLFARDAMGYHPTPAALVLKPAAAAVAAQVGHFASQVETAARRATRRIRITCEEHLAQRMVVPALARFAAEHPDVQVEVDSTSALRDLNAGEADIAIRAGAAPDGANLIRRKLREDRWAVYCSAAYAAARGAPRSMADLPAHPMVSLEAAVEGARALGVADGIRQVLSSMPAVRAAILTGAYVGALPAVVAEDAPELQLCFELPGAVSAIWLVYPERLRGAPEVRALADVLAKAFRPQATAKPDAGG